MKKCPVCKSDRWVVALQPAGFLEKLAGWIIRVHPYRCAACLVDFYRFGLQVDTNYRQVDLDKSAFLKSRQSADFDDLVNQLKEAEDRLQKRDAEDPAKKRTWRELGSARKDRPR